MSMDYRFAAGWLAKIASNLRQYEETREDAAKLLAVSAELYKLAPPLITVAQLEAIRPKLTKSDPNGGIPVPVGLTPKGSGPVAINARAA